MADFGDGYTQRGGDGLNPVQDTFSLIWNGLKIAQADEIDAFLKARKGYESFDWIPPREVSTRKFICQEWSRQYITPDIDSISATFIEVFDL